MANESDGTRKPPAGLKGPDQKRVTNRARKRLMVRFGVAKPDRTAFTKNISETGLFINTNQVVRPGTMVQVEVHFPDRTFSHWARVVWAKQVPAQLAHIVECGMGIRFMDASADWPEYYLRWKEKSGVD